MNPAEPGKKIKDDVIQEVSMSENCSQNCSSCGEDCPSRSAAKIEKEALNPASSVKKVVAVVSGKGGVGKSLVSGLLSVSLNRSGMKTAMLDADITGPSVPKMFGLNSPVVEENGLLKPVRTKTGIDVMSLNLLLEDETSPVVWRGPVIAGTVKQFWTDVFWDNIDVMVVDMPPGTGDVPLTVFQSLPIDGIIVVTSPQDLVSMVVEKAINMASLMNIPVYGIVENMSYIECPDCGKRIEIFGTSNSDKIAGKHGLEILARLPMNASFAELCDSGRIEDVDSDYLGKAVEKIKES